MARESCPILDLRLSREHEGGARCFVLLNVGGSPAVEIAYSLGGEGYEQKTGRQRTLGVGEELPLLPPSVRKEKHLSDLKRLPEVTATYRDVQGRQYRYP